MTSRVSIVMPAYNAEKHIELSINSVMSQTYRDFEMIIVDDGSSDNTHNLAKSLAQKYPQIQLVHQQNKGCAAARNTGIQHSNGIYIAFLDADDLWAPEKLDVQVAHLDSNPNLGMSFGKVQFMTSTGEYLKTVSSTKSKGITPKDFFKENLAVTPSNTIFRRNALLQVGGFDEEFSFLGLEDTELFLRVICNDWQVEGVNQILSFYRLSDSGMSSELLKMEQGFYLFVEKVKSYSPELVQQNYFEAEAKVLRYLARKALRLGLSGNTAWQYMIRSLSADWYLALKEPRRTFLTMLGAIYMKIPVISSYNFLFR